MAGRIRDDDIHALRERADLAAVIGDYTALRRAGSRLKGLCPFHAEKTPSFTVDPAKGYWHCFGCSEGGDVYGFLQKIEALTFPESVERLAALSGYTLHYEELSPGQRRAIGKRTRLYEALGDAATFFSDQLAGPAGAAARDYLTSRGLGEAEAKRFGLGWAPDGWDALTRHLLDAGYTVEELTEAGVVSQGRRGPIDRFRGRVIFPIKDKSGRSVIAFGGRVIPGLELDTAPREGTPPKYINSTESPVYRKSETLYGLDLARAEIQRRREAVVVEGYMDVIGLHLAGVRHVVATCGTALTADHFRVLEQFGRRVVLALDADDAGYAAADRARELAEQAGVREVAVLPLPEGRDPADLAAEGAPAVEAALRGVKTAVEFQIEHLLREADTSTPEGQIEAYRRTFPLLARVPDRVLRFTYVRDVVGPQVRVSPDRIEAELDRHLASLDHEDARANERSRPAPAAPGDVSAQLPKDPQLLLERELLRTVLQLPDLLPSEWNLVTAEDFRAPMSRQLHAALVAAPAGNLDAVLGVLPDDDARSRVRALAMSDPTVEPDAGHVAELVARLRAAAVQREIDEVRAQLSAVDGATTPDVRRSLTSRLFSLEQRRRQVIEEQAR